MPREHCHKTDTFLPEPTAASHPCSAEKRKNKCPATSRRHDRRRTGRGPEDTPCMNEPPLSAAGEARPAVDAGHAVRMRDLHGAVRADGGNASRPLRPGTKAPFRPDISFLATAARQGRAGRRPAAGSGRTRPQAGGNGRPSPRENIGTSATKEKKEESPHGEGPRRSPEESADNPGREAQPAALPRRRTCPATETGGCGGNDFPRCLFCLS